jgi:hypothetical protein
VLYFSGGPRYDICMVEKVKVGSLVKFKHWVRPEEVAMVVNLCVMGNPEMVDLFFGPSEGLRMASVSNLEVVKF